MQLHGMLWLRKDSISIGFPVSFLKLNQLNTKYYNAFLLKMISLRLGDVISGIASLCPESFYPP